MRRGRKLTVNIKGMTPEQKNQYQKDRREIRKYESFRNQTERQCKACGEMFPNTLEYFFQDGKGGVGRLCKPCESKKSSDRKRKEHAKRAFGMSLEEYDAWFENARCSICFENERKKLVLDHNHRTGKIRGVLCNHCNSGIGFFDDNTELLECAVVYLKSNE